MAAPLLLLTPAIIGRSQQVESLVELHQRRSEQSRAIRPNLNRIGTLTNSSGLPHFSF